LGISDELLLDIAESEIEVANSLITVATEKYNKSKEMLAEAQIGLAQATTDAEKTKWQESIDYYTE
jgi:hypothetical protein